MRRALELATRGASSVSPDPMVGAVITAPDKPDNRRRMAQGLQRTSCRSQRHRIGKAEDEHLLSFNNMRFSRAMLALRANPAVQRNSLSRKSPARGCRHGEILSKKSAEGGHKKC